ncbi:MAG: glycosyltransferase family 39 protein [Patescibacteria group bacterium]|nr:glycosyltransferase family 39 protein [Patescibacteria group bacterium]
MNLYLTLEDSQTIDEGPHISGGLSYLKTGDFRINPEHPPLVKELSTLPLLGLNISIPTDHESWHNYNQWDFGRQLIYHSSAWPDTIVFLARLFPIILGLILGFYIYRWAKEIFGFQSGLLALFLYCLSPNFIAHSHLVTTDTALALFFVLIIYYFGKYLKNPSKKILFVAAIVFALGFNTKYSAVLFIPVLIFIYFWHWLVKKEKTKLRLKKFLLVFLVFFVITAATTFMLYGFEMKKPLEEPRVQKLYQERQELIDKNLVKTQPLFIQPLVSLANPETKTGSFIYNFAKNISVPAYTYWRGFFSVLSHNHWGHGAYLMGMTGTQGWWYYFIIAYLIKTPLTTVLLSLFVFILFVWKKIIKNIEIPFWQKIKNIDFKYWLIIWPPLIYFLWSLTSHINLGVRHILPVYPFIFIGLSSLVSIKIRKRKRKIIYNTGLTLMIIYYLATNIMIFPFYLSYFNEAIGGPENGHQYLLDSNIDWGQDVKRLEKWLDKNNIKNYHTLLFGSLDSSYYLDNQLSFPKNEEVRQNGISPGYYIISAGPLFDPNGDWHWPHKYKPINKIGYSIYIYQF